jgi:HAD superfamily hydrolase (TIGR01484 family)
MRFIGVATDYDGTIARSGRVDKELIDCLKQVRSSGRKLMLVTGRHLPDLLQVFPEVSIFDRVVTENGALLYRPSAHQENLLVERVPAALVRELERRHVEPLAVGRGILATWQPHEATVLDAIKNLGLDYHVVFNKGAVMVLPSGINKATGLGAALAELNLSWHNAVGFGDAENDHAFMRLCECSVAVANALESVKETADIVCEAEHGRGVLEVLRALLSGDLIEYAPKLTRSQVRLGATRDGEPVSFPSFGAGILLAGPSGGGKSTAAFGILERLADRGYQLCILDPEADYSGIKSAVTLGTTEQEPSPDEVMQALADPSRNVTVNLLALPIAGRPQFLSTLFPRLQELRVSAGRPHWIVIDEAHHFMPPSRPEASEVGPQDMGELLLVTVHPNHVAPKALSKVKTLIVVGASPQQTLGEFVQAVGGSPVPQAAVELQRDEALVWFRDQSRSPAVARIEPGTRPARRHGRKYAQGELGPDNSFYFRGPANQLNLRAQNLEIFLQLAEGIDDATWEYHLDRGDYSHWFRSVIKNQALASEAERIEQSRNLSPAESRTAVKAAIERHFTGAV